MASLRRISVDLGPILVGVLCMSGAATSAFLLYLDFARPAGEGSGPSMARIERRRSKVRRKPSTSFAWSNAQQNEMLFLRDSVQTSEGSAASIRFLDGTLLELGENSLVVIDSVESLPLEYVKGSLILHGTAGDSKVSVGSDGKARSEDLSVRLTSPAPLARFFSPSAEGGPVRFAWKIRKGHESKVQNGLTLQISPNKKFVGPKTRSVEVRGGAEATVALGEGLYFWRLVSGDHALSGTSQFNVTLAAVPQPVTPAGGQKLPGFGERIVHLRWSAHGLPPEAALGKHVLQVAGDSEFRQIVAAREIDPQSGTALMQGLPAGAYFWRIHSWYGGVEVSSRTETFELIKAEQPSLALVQPPDKASLQHPSQVRMAWRSDTQGLEYEVEVQGPKGALPPVRSRALSYSIDHPALGDYRWRVIAFHRGNKVVTSEWSAFSLFDGPKISLRGPEAGREFRFWDKPAVFEFTWEAGAQEMAAVPGASFQVVAALDPTFKDAVRGPRVSERSVSSQKIPLVQGKIFWKVEALDAQGKLIGTSDTKDFFFGALPTLPAPEGVSPPLQAELDLSAQASNPIASWKPVKDAERYEFELFNGADSRAPASTKPIQHLVTGKTEVELKGLKKGTYSWAVRAVDPLRRRGEASVGRFKVVAERTVATVKAPAPIESPKPEIPQGPDAPQPEAPVEVRMPEPQAVGIQGSDSAPSETPESP